MYAWLYIIFMTVIIVLYLLYIRQISSNKKLYLTLGLVGLYTFVYIFTPDRFHFSITSWLNLIEVIQTMIVIFGAGIILYNLYELIPTLESRSTKSLMIMFVISMAFFYILSYIFYGIYIN